MIRRPSRVASWLILSWGLGGCAVVDPRADYEQAAQHVAEATGQTRCYRPHEHESAAQAVEDLLHSGLTADEAVQVCLLNNPELQGALLGIGAARADVVQAGLFSNPALSLGLRLPDGGGLANFETALVQDLTDLWQIPARRRAAERVLDRTILEVARRVSVTASDTKTAYYRAKQVDRKREIAAESVQIAQQVLDLALARQQAGAGSEVDVNLARSEVQDAELAQRIATLEAFEARAALATLLSLSIPPDALELSDGLPEPPAWTVPDSTLLVLAADHRLDIQAAVKATDAAKARIRQERLKLFPTLEIGVALEREERRAPAGRNILADSLRASLDAGEPRVDIAPQEKSGGQDTIIGPTIGLELPIFNQNQGGIARARFEYEQSRRLLESLVAQVNQQVRVAAARARTAWSNVGFYRDQVLPLRETSLDLARTAYQAGRTPLLNVLEAQRALLTARAGHADSLQASAGALVELEKATGQPLSRILEATQGTDQEASHNEREDESP